MLYKIIYLILQCTITIGEYKIDKELIIKAAIKTELDECSHDDYIEEYLSKLDFYLSNVNDETLKYENLLKKLEEALRKLKRRKSKSISMLLDDVITKDDYELFINDIDEQIKNLEHEVF